MIEKLLAAHLRPIGRRQAQAELLKKLTLCWSVAAVTWIAIVWLTRLTHIVVPFFGWIFLASTFVLSFFLYGTIGRITNYNQIARRIEQEDPQLQSLLLAAVEQQPDPETGRLSYLQERVITEALEAHRKSHWGQQIDRQLRFYRSASALSLLVMLSLIAFSARHFTKPALFPPSRKLGQRHRDHSW